jgi:hypothetical protein
VCAMPRPRCLITKQQRREIREFIAWHECLTRCNASMSRAHREHGEKFAVAYARLISQNPEDPFACAAVQNIMFALDPGQALMSWHYFQGRN